MSSAPRRSCLLVAAALLAATLVGCSGGDDPEQPAHSHDVVRAVTRALDSRARVVRRADAEKFERLIGGAPEFRRAQREWFANMTQLPLERLRYRLLPETLVRDGDTFSAVAEVTLQLEGYDVAPVVSETRLRLRQSQRRPGRYRLTAIEPADPQPWDLGPIDVRVGDGVLGIFDPGSLDQATALLASAEDGIASVAAVVPYDWSRTVVMYALSDPAFLLGLDDVPGDDPARLDAVSFAAGQGTRFVLNPRMLDRTGRERDQLVRHELTHVAIGNRDDHVPVWLSEGLAEYVAVRPLAPEDRRIPAGAVRAAQAGPGDLPEDASFNGTASNAHYGLSWWAVEYLADAYGDRAPWDLLDALGEPDADLDDVLLFRYATDTSELARQASRLILALYGPAAGVP